MGEEERVAGLLVEAVRVLPTEPAAAARMLEEVCGALTDQPDLQDVAGRAFSLLAQAHLAHGAIGDSERAVRSALRILRGLNDGEGLAEVRNLQERIAAERDREKREVLARAQAAPLAATTLQDLEARAGSDLALADILIKHAGALRLHGRPDEARESARRAVDAADRAEATRERVLARITLAEVDRASASEALVQAHAIADDASETNLIGLVARAAALALVDLPRQYGPLVRSPR
ncbi:MAG: hypothetical protein H6734_10955 [Alphaproteobacteria bacterium]|nr:hypothetical protein [Alphaproteobacteria bacterium]